jgi:uncharacterized protein YbbC (DUF1343 family)
MPQEPLVTIGLEQLVASPPPALKNQRLGLLCNAASLDRRLVHSAQCLHDCFGDGLRALFTPQHGFYAEKQDNMIESTDRRDPRWNIPVFSLYSHTRQPSSQMLAEIDTLLVDMQDVGTRVYTFIYTMSYCMEAAKQYGKKMIVLDRPNPIGGALIEGNCLMPEWGSFVGRYPIPMRHGLTIGEIARLFNEAYGIGCDLEVIPMAGWRRDMYFTETGLAWTAPSPNMPTPTTAIVYPGQVIWEGTNVSEGRGTTQPFEIFGAPYLNTHRILEFIGGDRLEGAVLRPMEFEPTSNKWRGEICHGFQLHITDARQFRPYRTSLQLLQAILQLHGDRFVFKLPPYEYEFERRPIDLILGDGGIAARLAAPEPLSAIELDWEKGLRAFRSQSKKYFLYR